eukprot:1155735-Pelagomonas_calceolata.AAC.10
MDNWDASKPITTNCKKYCIAHSFIKAKCSSGLQRSSIEVQGPQPAMKKEPPEQGYNQPEQGYNQPLRQIKRGSTGSPTNHQDKTNPQSRAPDQPYRPTPQRRVPNQPQRQKRRGGQNKEYGSGKGFQQALPAPRAKAPAHLMYIYVNRSLQGYVVDVWLHKTIWGGSDEHIPLCYLRSSLPSNPRK